MQIGLKSLCKLVMKVHANTVLEYMYIELESLCKFQYFMEIV